MLLNEESGDTSEELTADTAATAFESLLSSEDEDQNDAESSPTQESPASESDEAEASTEQADAEDASETENESEEASEEAPAPEAVLDPNLKVKVRIDGQEVEVTLDEALKGYSRTSDYTRKTQELATQRKTQESEFNAVKGERQMYAQRLAQVQQLMLDLTPQEPDWTKVQTETPEQFPAMWAQWSAHKDRLRALADERAAADAAVRRDRDAEQSEYLTRENESLLNAIPAWKDAETAKAEKAKMVGYVKSLGYTPEDVGRITDHRLIVLIDKAMKYDEAQAKKPVIATKIAEKIKAATPGAAQKDKGTQSKAQKARERLAKSGSVDDAAEAMMAFLDD